MGFFTFLKALDELVYELISWLVFYPVTLWRTLRRPLATMEYADTELGDTDQGRYEDSLSPPLFLLVSLLLAHGLELALVGENVVVQRKTGLAALVDDDASLILLRLVLFSAIPMIMAVLVVRAKGQAVTRTTLRLPFFSQCYVASAFALAVGVGSALLQEPGWERATGLTLVASALVYFTMVETIWFARQLGVGWMRGLARALVGLLLSIALLISAAVLFAR